MANFRQLDRRVCWHIRTLIDELREMIIAENIRGRAKTNRAAWLRRRVAFDDLGRIRPLQLLVDILGKCGTVAQRNILVFVISTKERLDFGD